MAATVAVPASADGMLQFFAPVAASRALLFVGRNLIIGRNNTVHRVTMAEWMGVLHHPAPECHQGWSGFGLGTDLHPTVSPVTCKKCKPDDPGQLAFDLVGA